MIISATVERHSAELLEIPGIVGLAQGAREGRTVVQVLVERRTPDLVARLPKTLDGYAVVVEESGEIQASSYEHCQGLCGWQPAEQPPH